MSSGWTSFRGADGGGGWKSCNRVNEYNRPVMILSSVFIWVDKFSRCRWGKRVGGIKFSVHKRMKRGWVWTSCNGLLMQSFA